jgi:hypothetical protein
VLPTVIVDPLEQRLDAVNYGRLPPYVRR